MKVTHASSRETCSYCKLNQRSIFSQARNGIIIISIKMYEICARQEIKVEMAGTPKPQLK